MRRTTSILPVEENRVHIEIDNTSSTPGSGNVQEKRVVKAGSGRYCPRRDGRAHAVTSGATAGEVSQPSKSGSGIYSALEEER